MKPSILTMKNQEWIWGHLCSSCYFFKPEMRKVPKGRAGRPDTRGKGEPAKALGRCRRQRSAGRKALPCWLSRPDSQRAEGREGDRARAEGPRGRADLPCRCGATRRCSCRPLVDESDGREQETGTGIRSMGFCLSEFVGCCY